MKRFIAYIAQRGDDNFQKVKYEVHGDCPDSMAFQETRFPILPLMNGVVGEGEKIQAILMTAKSSQDTSRGAEYAQTRNLQWAKEEILEWAKTHNVEVAVNVIEYAPLSTFRDVFVLFEQLISAMDDGFSEDDRFYADITYGVRVMTYVALYALQYIHIVRKARVENIVYGEMNWVSKTAELHDVTALFRMSSIISTVAEMKMDNPARFIHMALEDMGIGIGDENCEQ